MVFFFIFQYIQIGMAFSKVQNIPFVIQKVLWKRNWCIFKLWFPRSVILSKRPVPPLQVCSLYPIWSLPEFLPAPFAAYENVIHRPDPTRENIIGRGDITGKIKHRNICWLAEVRLIIWAGKDIFAGDNGCLALFLCTTREASAVILVCVQLISWLIPGQDLKNIVSMSNHP